MTPTVAYQNYSLAYYWLPQGTCPGDSCSVLTGLQAGSYSVTVKLTYTINGNVVASGVDPTRSIGASTDNSTLVSWTDTTC